MIERPSIVVKTVSFGGKLMGGEMGEWMDQTGQDFNFVETRQKV